MFILVLPHGWNYIATLFYQHDNIFNLVQQVNDLIKKYIQESNEPTTVDEEDVEDDGVDLMMGDSDSEDEGFNLQELLPPSPLPPVASLPPSPLPPAVSLPPPPVAPSLPPASEPVTRPRKRRRDISPTSMVSEARRMRVSSFSEIMAELSPMILDQLERATDVGIPKEQFRPKVMNIRHVVSQEFPIPYEV